MLPAFAHPETAVFAVQDRGSAALESGDPNLTQADLFERELPPMKIGLHLFPRSWEADAGMPVSEAFPNGAKVTITYTRGSGGLPCARIAFGDGPGLEVWHTPGHSPDSICLRMGSLLFIGDLLFAAAPGIAGICGWDQKALVQSTSSMQEVTAGGGITLVCPGHGRVVSAPDATRMLSAVRTDALALSDIAELNRDRAEQAAAFAEDCMEQVNELFTIMAGRLYYVSYVMDELGESDMAERMDTLIPGDTIDELLEAFSAFAGEHHRRGNVSDPPCPEGRPGYRQTGTVFQKGGTVPDHRPHARGAVRQAVVGLYGYAPRIQPARVNNRPCRGPLNRGIDNRAFGSLLL